MDRRVIKTREAIQQAYFSLLREEDGKKVTIAEIARRADIDRKTFYLHYVSVDDIVKDFSESRLDKVFSIMDEEAFLGTAFNIGRLFVAVNEEFGENVEFYRYMARSKNFDPLWEEMEVILNQKIVEIYAKILKTAKEEIEVYARFYSAAFVAVYRDWLKGNLDVSLEMLASLTERITLIGARRDRRERDAGF